MCVKITQPNGWFLESSKFPEVLTIPQAMTPRQQKSASNHASQQIEVMSGLLVQSTGMQVTMADSCEPVQFLKKDGKSLHFAKKSDLTSCADVSFLKSQNFPAHNFTYIVVGGNSGILSAYSVDFLGNIIVDFQMMIISAIMLRQIQ